MTTDHPTKFCITRRFEAAPERVFDAWLNPDTARKWLFTSPTSEKNDTEIDARVGGKWTITDRREGSDQLRPSSPGDKSARKSPDLSGNARPHRLV